MSHRWLLHLLLLTATCGGLRRVVIRHFIELCRTLLHIRLHLIQQLALLCSQLSLGVGFTACRRFGRGLHANLTILQLFDVAPAFFRFRRQAVTRTIAVHRQQRRVIRLVVRNEIEATDKDNQKCDG
ncbi:hypothetical protein D3C81_1443170 [compost metagenome]